MEVHGFLAPETYPLLQKLHEFFPDFSQEIILQALRMSHNNLEVASEILLEMQDIQTQQEHVQPQPKEVPVKPPVQPQHFAAPAPRLLKSSLKLQTKIFKQFPAVPVEIIGKLMAELNYDLVKIVSYLIPIYGLPKHGKYRKCINRLSQFYPDLDLEVIASLLIDAKFKPQDVKFALAGSPDKQRKIELRTKRQANKLSKWFPEVTADEARHVLEDNQLDFNKALAVLKARNSPEEKAKAVHKRLLELYGAGEAELLEEIAQQSGFDLQQCLRICTEIFGPPGVERGPEPLSKCNLRNVPSLPQAVETDAGYLNDQEFEDKQREMETLKLAFKDSALQSKELRKAGRKEEAKYLSQESKMLKTRHNQIYKEIFEETFRRNNLRRTINTLDLHGLRPDEAMTVLESYLDVMQAMVRDQGLREFKLLIITGWGRHNPNHRSILKEKTHSTLVRKRLNFYEFNRGSYEVVLNA